MKIINVKKSKIKILALAASVLTALACVTFTKTPKVGAADLNVEGMNEEYFVGENFVVPSASFRLSNTESLPAEFNVSTPDGKTLQSSAFTLDEYGKYTITYTASKDGNEYSKDVSFDVVKPLFELDGYGSVEYGIHEYFKDADGNALAEDVDGLKVGLGGDTTLRYNRKIDLNELTKKDSLVTFNVTPENVGYLEAQTINFKLVDENDSSKFIVLVTDSYGAQSSSYVWAGINGTSTMYVGNTFYQASLGVQRGIATNLSFGGKPYDEKGGIVNNTISFNFDYLNKQIWLYNGGKYTQLLNLGAFEDVFDGFSTGRVLLEVYTTKCRAEKCNFVLRDIAGHDLSGSKLYDGEAPEIEVDYGDYDGDSYPYGAIGYNYPIFDASAIDVVDGKVEVESFVFYNYYSDDKISVNVVEGSFKPSKKGTYTVLYVAKDRYGNESRKTVDVEVASFVEPIDITVEALQKQSYRVGDLLTLPDAEIIGGHGSVNLEKTVWLGEEKLEIFNGKVRLLSSGKCTIKYEATDYVGQRKVETIEITVDDVDSPVFVSDVDAMVEKVFIAGNRYKIPEVQALAKTNGGYSMVGATVSVDNGTISNGYYVPSTVGDAKLTYTAALGGKSSSIVVERPVYSLKDSDGLIDFKRLFLADDGVESSYGESGFAKYSFNTDGTITFANKLLSESFSTKFEFEKSGLNAIEISLIDVYNPDVELRMVITKTRGAGVLTINGGDGHAVGARFIVGEETSLGYKNSLRKITLNSYEFDVSDVFDGFVSDYVYFSIKAIGVTDGADLVVKQVCNQLLKNDVSIDMIAPVVAVVGDYGGNYERGHVYDVTKVLAYDVVQGEIEDFKMSVKRSDGTYVSIDGVEMRNVAVKEISVTLADYGSYSFSFIAKDDSGNKTSFTYVVHVLDDQAPTITLKGACTTSGKIGDTITVGSVSLSDNVDSEEQIGLSVMVKSPSGVLTIVDKTFKAEESGVYTVYYYAADTFGNFTMSQYQVEIK